MKKLVLSQTCQGAILRDLLLSSPELAEAYQCLFVPNYALEADAAKPAAVDTLVAELPNCDVLIYHDIAAFDFPARLAQLPPGALAIKVPYVTSTIYWPSHDYRHPCRLAPRGTTALIPWPCRVLNDLIVRLRDEDAIVRAYLDTDLTAGLDLSRHLADQLDYLHKSQVGTPFALAECVERDFATQRLFHMINHPAMPLMRHMADVILDHLGMAPLVGERFDPFCMHQLPVHPSVAQGYGLAWCDADTRYYMLDRDYSFEEYVTVYVRAYVAQYGYASYPAPPAPPRGRAWRRVLRHAVTAIRHATSVAPQRGPAMSKPGDVS